MVRSPNGSRAERWRSVATKTRTRTDPRKQECWCRLHAREGRADRRHGRARPSSPASRRAPRRPRLELPRSPPRAELAGVDQRMVPTPARRSSCSTVPIAELMVLADLSNAGELAATATSSAARPAPRPTSSPRRSPRFPPACDVLDREAKVTTLQAALSELEAVFPATALTPERAFGAGGTTCLDG